MSVLSITNSQLASPVSSSPLRDVFQTTQEMKSEFSKFLQTIFFQLDEPKLFAAMDELLSNPDLSDLEIYEKVLERIDTLKTKLPLYQQLHALSVLKKGMGVQADQLLKGFDRQAFKNYLEIYDRRYAKTLQKAAGLSLNGQIYAACDRQTVNLQDRLEAGALIGSYPYKKLLPLNESNCIDPLREPEKTHKPLGDEIPDGSLDLIGCLGGLHHVPPEKAESFAASFAKKLAPGGVVLFRDHDVISPELRDIASVVHTFVNATAKISPEIERKEIREFKSLDEWTALMENQGFERISPEGLILKDDPTANAMIAFVKKPKNWGELQQAISYRSDAQRSKQGTRATWIEWGNVRSSKQYAEFIQTHPSYAFDFIGHLGQHWKYFHEFWKESRNDPEIRLKDLVFSGDMAMNQFILTTAIAQCLIGQLSALPSIALAKWKYGEKWKEVAELTDLDRFFAKTEKEYADSIDSTPFYMFPYLGKMKEMWKVIAQSKESWATRGLNVVNGISSSFGFLAKAAISAPIRVFYTAEANLEPETVKAVVYDPENELERIATRWEREKDPLLDKQKKIEVVMDAGDGYKFVSFPRYRPFTKICGYLSETTKLKLIEIGGQKEISIDVIRKPEDTSPLSARLIYEMDKLQDPENRRYATYSVPVPSLGAFIQEAGPANIEYVHE